MQAHCVYALPLATVVPHDFICCHLKGGALIEHTLGVVCCLVAQTRGRGHCGQCQIAHVACHPGIAVSGWGTSCALFRYSTLSLEPFHWQLSIARPC